MHSLLKRQLRRHFSDSFSVPEEWRGFIQAVNEAYREFDSDRGMLERSLELSSQELLKANSEMRAIFQAIPDLLLRMDHEGTILECSTAGGSDFSRNPGELLGKRFQDVTSRKVAEQFNAVMESVRETKSTAVIEYCLPFDKRSHYYEARLIPLVQDQVIAIVRNITDRKEAEARLRESERQLESILHGSPIPAFVISKDHKVLNWNRALEELTGVKGSEMIGTDRHSAAFYATQRPCIADLLVDQDLDTIPKWFQEYSKSTLLEEAVEAVGVYSLPGGEERIIHCTAAAIRDSRKELVGAMETFEDITSRKQAENALRESEVRLKLAMDLAKLVQWEYDVETGIFSFDEQFYALYGTTSQHEGGPFMTAKAYVRRFIPSEQSDVLAGEIAKLSETTDPDFTCQFEHRIIRADGQERHIVARYKVICDQTGKVVKARGANQDVTELKRAEEALSKYLQQHRQLNLLQQALLGPGEPAQKMRMITDEVVNIFGADFCRIWCISPGDLCDEGCVHASVTEGPHVCKNRNQCLHLVASSGRYTHTDGPAHKRVPLGAYKIGLLASGHEHKFLTNNATQDPRIHNREWARELGLVSFAGYHIRPPGGETLGVLALFSKRAIAPEEDAQLDALSTTVAQLIGAARAEAALRESEQKFRAISDSTQDAIILLDNQGRITFWNPGAERIFQYSHHEALGQNAHLLLAPQRYLESHFPAFGEFAAEGKGQLVNKTLELLALRKNGEELPIELSLSALQISGKWHAVGIVRDIAERKRAEEERRRLEERLQRAEKMEALGTLAGGVAHDLNNVLGIVVGYSELLLCSLVETSSEGLKAMQILKGGQRAAAIVEDLLTLARRGVSNKKVLNLNKVITECTTSPEFTRISSCHPNIRIKIDLEAHLLNMSGSAVHLGKSLLNLVSNAAEAMPMGGLISIKTWSQYLDKPICGYDELREGDYIVLSVSDTGEGIPACDLKRIFEPFYTKKAMGRSGTGLGLPVVWGTVKDHKGYINVESEEGKGTTFTLYFPVTRDETTREQISLSAAEYMGNGQSILIVDDVKEQRELAGTMLEKLNYSVVTVSSGEEAVEYLKQNKVDLVVLDMIMNPGMDGLDAYAEILEIHPRQKAIIVSGFSETERVSKAKALGAGSYVRKPYMLESLGLAVRKELDRPIRPVNTQA